jgi:hypothetical protein
VLYSQPYRRRLTFADIRELADAIERPPLLFNESQLWQAYAALEKSKVRGASAKRILTDLVSLVRFAIHQDNELIPFPERVDANFQAWLAQQEGSPSPLAGEGRGEGAGSAGQGRFTPEQRHWLEMIRDHIAANLTIDADDFDGPLRPGRRARPGAPALRRPTAGRARGAQQGPGCVTRVGSQWDGTDRGEMRVHVITSGVARP